MAPRMSVTVHFNGPFFDGRDRGEVLRFVDDIKDEVAREGAGMMRAEALTMNKSGRATGRYASEIATKQAPVRNDVIIWDHGIVYGNWLEGTSKRNNSTRFKGYHAWRRVRNRLRARAPEIARAKLAEFTGRM